MRLGLLRLYERLFAAFGPQGWWPADTPFEVALGAVLTQNTAWRNVERAMAGLAPAGLTEPAALARAPRERVAEAIRPSGYYNVKTRRLQALATTWIEAGGATGLATLDTAALRARLLGTHGIGRETADDIVLYAFDRPRFVVDAYTRRILSRLGDAAAATMAYDELRERFEGDVGRDPGVLGEYHALFVRLGTTYCRPRPRCRECLLRDVCETGLYHLG